MIEAEFVRNLNCNYQRIMLDNVPEEARYQYCIVTRGGIKGLLDCSLRYINGQAYLYYDISSTQSMVQLHAGKSIGREWVKSFLSGVERVRREMARFLLDDGNILWFPEQIFQDLEKESFYFVYVPYYEQDNGFGQLLDYLAEHIDYTDQVLVDCVYKMHRQYSCLGKDYLEALIYEDAKLLDCEQESLKEESLKQESLKRVEAAVGETVRETNTVQRTETVRRKEEQEDNRAPKDSKRGILSLWDEKRKRQREERRAIQYETEQMLRGMAVCEESEYNGVRSGGVLQENLQNYEHDMELEERSYGRTVYIEGEAEEVYRGLYTQEGKLVYLLRSQSTILGKKKEEADCVLEDMSVSRMHARVTMDKDGVYLEDMNSTNGTFKNGLRLQPYERKRLEAEDEIRLGKSVLIYR